MTAERNTGAPTRHRYFGDGPDTGLLVTEYPEGDVPYAAWYPQGPNDSKWPGSARLIVHPMPGIQFENRRGVGNGRLSDPAFSPRITGDGTVRGGHLKGALCTPHVPV